MNTQWDDVINELCLLEGMELMVDSSFDECHGHFTAVLKGVNEGKKMVHMRKVGVADPDAVVILSFAECRFENLVVPNKALGRVFMLTAHRKPGEEITLMQKPFSVVAALQY